MILIPSSNLREVLKL